MRFNLYTPHINQIKIHESKARYRVVVAGRRFGKSALGLNEALARAFQMQGQIIWIILPLFKQAKEIYWIDPDITKYFMPYVQAGLIKADKSELSLFIKKTGSWIRLKGSDNYDSLRGSGLDLIIWDEVADVKQEAFDTIEPALADSPNHEQLYIGTPKGLNWFHDFALKGDHEGKIPDFGKPIKPHPKWQTWHFTSYDNLAWPEGSKKRKSFVEYIDEKRTEAEEKGKLSFFHQEYMASFEESAGRFFPKWFFNTHVYQGSLFPKPEFKIYESMDWGRSKPFAWYMHLIKLEEIIDMKFKRIYTFAELYGTGKSPHEWAEEIIDKRMEFGVETDQIEKILVDPSMFDPLSDGSTGIKDQFNAAFEELIGTKMLFEKGTKKRTSRWATMDNWIRMAVDGMPYWIITKDCPNLIRTIPLMEPDENDIEDLNTDLEDHACFCPHVQILTRNGLKPIIDVNEGDQVWTPIGWSKVLERIERIDILTSCQRMKVTANHPFLTQGGFRQSKDLKRTDKLWNVYISKESPIGDIRVLQDFPTGAISGVVQRRIEAFKSSYISMFGNTLMEKFLKNTIFITKMIIGIETILKILRWSIVPNIMKSIGRLFKVRLKDVVLLLRIRLERGIKAKQDMNGTKSMGKRFLEIERQSLRFVSYVEKSLEQKIMPQGFAVRTTKCQCIEGKSRVYNLKTDTGMYTVNGVVVSNCDSVSYFLPDIRWVDSKLGLAKRPAAKKKIPQPAHLVDLSKFAKAKK